MSGFLKERVSTHLVQNSREIEAAIKVLFNVRLGEGFVGDKDILAATVACGTAALEHLLA
jgi:hypothetical protein